MRLNNTYDLTGDNASVVRGFYASVPGGGWVGITMNRVAVFFLSVKSEVGIRNLTTPSGVFSRFTNPLARRMCLKRAFWSRSDSLQYFSPTRMAGN
jgi:hypothetical protein